MKNLSQASKCSKPARSETRIKVEPAGRDDVEDLEDLRKVAVRATERASLLAEQIFDDIRTRAVEPDPRMMKRCAQRLLEARTTLYALGFVVAPAAKKKGSK